MRRVSGSEARSAIAHLLLGSEATHPQLGSVVLHPHQAEAVERLRRLVDERGGALLADDVGLGKTYTALALAGERRTLVVIPAALRNAWQQAARDTGTHPTLVSMEQLGRGRPPPGPFDFVIIDEAQHFRTRRTRRFESATQLCQSSPVLLLTATPVQNHERDLRALLSLFLGETAYARTLDELAGFVVRRTADGVQAGAALLLPKVRPPAWLPEVPDEGCLDRILDLPPPLPPRDGTDGGALVAYSLVRQWASSRAALAAALRRRIARGLALGDALRAGRWPSRRELLAWCFADGAQQLSFPELTVAEPAAPADSLAMLAHVDAHVAALGALLRWLSVIPDPDVARASHLRALLRAHPGARVVAFSEFAETVRSLYAALAPHERVAALTHAGGRVAGGSISRREILERFAPGAGRPASPDYIHLLLTTDVLSEGVGLHDAGIVVHLDLAWNPARLEQRVGRLRRLGASHRDISVHLMRPPCGAERFLQLERRLRHKLGEAARAVGVAGCILPDSVMPRSGGAAGREDRIAARLAAWRTVCPPADPVIAAVCGRQLAALACVRRGSAFELVALDGSRVTTDRAAVEKVLSDANGADRDVPRVLQERLLEKLREWLARRETGSVVDLTALRLARSRRTMLRRVDGISRRLPRHAEPRMAPLVRAARAAATATLSAGAERVLDDLSRAPLPDDAWLRAVGQFAQLHARDRSAAASIQALLLVLPPEAG